MVNKLNIESQENIVILNVKSFMDNNANSMEEVVKGKFATKIKESIETQKIC
ncbi:hypothetical protein [Streptococcus uberis]